MIYNYNAQELLLVASRLVFALYAWVALILIMELTVVLFLVGKKNTQHKRFQPNVLGLHDYTSIRSTNNYDTFFVILGSLSHKNPSLNIDLPIIPIFLISYNITFGHSHLDRIDCRVWRSHKNKITSIQVTKWCVCSSVQRRVHALDP